MKAHQFEEITAALSIIITLLAYQFGINWLFYIYLVKSVFDTYCVIKESYKAYVQEEKAEKLTKEIEREIERETRETKSVNHGKK